jgi:hypothetical protein
VQVVEAEGLDQVNVEADLSLSAREARYATMPLKANAVLDLDDLATAASGLAEGKTVKVAPTRAGSRVAP